MAEIEKSIPIALHMDERASVRDALAVKKAVLVRQRNAETVPAIRELRQNAIERIDVLAMKFIA